MKNKSIYLILSVFMLLSSCEDYLDKSPDMGITDKEVFQNYLSYRGVLDKVYVLTCDPFLSTHGGGRFAFGDEGLCTAKGTCHRDLNDGNFMLTKDNLELGWYTGEAMNSVATNKMPIIAMAMRNLRTVNLCISRIDDLQDATSEQRDHLLGQAYFFRAWNYFEIIRRWGGMFKFDKVFLSDDDMDFPRLSYHESTDWLVSDLELAYQLLPEKWGASEKGRVTKAAALALKSMALLYSASPSMCPELNYNYDLEICKKAATAAWEAIDYINRTGCNRLMPGKTAEEYSKIFYNKDIMASDEAIFYQTKRNGKRAISEWNANFVPNSMCAANVHCASPTQNMADMFEMADGRTIKDAGADYDDQNPYVNRDPRFYYDILYNGVKWGNNKGVPHYFELWEYNTYDNSKSADMMALFSQTYNPRCPYLIRKWWPETANKWENDYNYYMPAIYIRVAQLYLDFAEAANEAYGPETKVPGTDMSAVDAINIIRNRVGAVPVRSEYKANKEVFRDRIRNERAVELCFEDHRWYDIRRWRIAKDVVKVIYKAVITRTGKEQFRFEYMEHPDYKRVFEDKHYWYPIPKSQMEMLNNVEQNPGW